MTPAVIRPSGGRGALLASLAAAARGGDRAAFERLVVETSPQIYALALRLVGNEHDARDVVQETYLRAFRSIGRFRGEAAVSTWLHRIAANCSANHLARRRNNLATGTEAELAEVEQRSERSPEDAAGTLDDRAVLTSALAELPAALRVVVVLHDVCDLSHGVIATELGITRTASKVRLHRARRKLHDRLFAASDGGIAIAPRPADKPVVLSRRPVRHRAKVSRADAM